MPDYTRWLNAATHSEGEDLFAGLYAELKKIARGRMASERVGHTLEATGLVHEAWQRLQKSAPEQWRDRKQFFAAATEAMRRILVEAAAWRQNGVEVRPPYRSTDSTCPLSGNDQRLPDGEKEVGFSGAMISLCG